MERFPRKLSSGRKTVFLPDEAYERNVEYSCLYQPRRCSINSLPDPEITGIVVW